MSIFKSRKKEKKEVAAPKKVEEKTPTTPEVSSRGVGDSWQVLRQTWISEKATDLLSENKHVFLVEPKANKHMVKAAVEERYDVKVSSVNILNQAGKIKRWGSRRGRRAGQRKAIVTLKQGEKIEIT